MQIVLQGEACQLVHQLDQNHIVYETLDQPGPMALRVATANWSFIRAMAEALGFDRPDFYGQSEGVGGDPFNGCWPMQARVAPGLKKSGVQPASASGEGFHV